MSQLRNTQRHIYSPILIVGQRRWGHVTVYFLHVTHLNWSCHTHEWDMAFVWLSHVTRRTETCHTYECAMTWWELITVQLSERHRYKLDLSRIQLSHVTGKTETRHTFGWVMSQDCGTTRVICDMVGTRHGTVTVTFLHATHVYLNHDKHVSESSYIYKWVMSHESCHDGGMYHETSCTHIKQVCIYWERERENEQKRTE